MGKNSEIFSSDVIVNAELLRLHLPHKKTGVEIVSPSMNCLGWVEDGRHYFHSLDFDLLADGATEAEALSNLANVIMAQVDASIEDHTELLHPAPRPYWEKFSEVRRKHLTQSLLDVSPVGQMREAALTNAE